MHIRRSIMQAFKAARRKPALHELKRKSMKKCHAEGDDAGQYRGVDMHQVVATVFALLPEFNQVEVCTPDNFHYTITRRTAGVTLSELREGQRLLCTFRGRLGVVVTAKLIADAPTPSSG